MTGKSRTGPRHADDYYPTPFTVCQAAIAQLSPKPDCILDVGAGDGVWGREARQRWSQSTLVGVDIRDLPRPAAYNFWFPGTDFLHIKETGIADCILGNPPYKHADQFIHQSLRLLDKGGVLLFLLRMDFLGSVERSNKLWGKTPLERVIIGADRIKFTGSSPTHHHALYLWRKGYSGQPQLSWTRFKQASHIYDERQRQLPLPLERSA